jgi:hypothetical protein
VVQQLLMRTRTVQGMCHTRLDLAWLDTSQKHMATDQQGRQCNSGPPRKAAQCQSQHHQDSSSHLGIVQSGLQLLELGISAWEDKASIDPSGHSQQLTSRSQLGTAAETSCLEGSSTPEDTRHQLQVDQQAHHLPKHHSCHCHSLEPEQKHHPGSNGLHRKGRWAQ